jgi:hypothetical protein
MNNSFEIIDTISNPHALTGLEDITPAKLLIRIDRGGGEGGVYSYPKTQKCGQRAFQVSEYEQNNF